MAQRKYIRIINVATEDDEMQDSHTVAHITQDVPLVGHPHDSSLASQGICGESSSTTKRAPLPPPRYKKGDVIIIGMNSICPSIFMTLFYLYFTHYNHLIKF